MARTYHAEGRQLANFLRALLVLGAVILYFKIPGLHWGFFCGFIIAAVILAEIAGTIWTQKRRSQKKNRQQSQSLSKSKKPQPENTQAKQTQAKRTVVKQAGGPIHRASKECRSDEIILTSQLKDLSGTEFERLLALYFRAQGYTVKEVGVGGNDGGVDLVIVDRRGEKTAVQAKCYADHNKVAVQTVRELVAAKRNHDCILSLLITTSDLTGPAKKEAEQFKVDYWHGALVEQKLKAWGKWHPNNKTESKAKAKKA